MSDAILAHPRPAVNPPAAVDQPWYYVMLDRHMSPEQAAELDAFLDNLDAEAAATEIAARADEAADELLDYPESFVLWPRSSPGYQPAA